MSLTSGKGSGMFKAGRGSSLVVLVGWVFVSMMGESLWFRHVTGLSRFELSDSCVGLVLLVRGPACVGIVV